MATLLQMLGRAAVPALLCTRGAACANGHSFDDVTSLLHSSTITAVEVGAEWGLAVDPPVSQSDLEARLGSHLDMPRDAVDTMRVAPDELRLRPPPRTPEACTDAQKDEGCCNPLATAKNLHWVTNVTHGGEWSYSNNYLRFDFKDDLECGGTSNLSQNGTAWVMFEEPAATRVDLWVEGVAEKHHEYLLIYTFRESGGGGYSWEYHGYAMATQAFDGGDCRVMSCEMCKVSFTPVSIVLPAGTAGLWIQVESQDHKWHVGAYFQIYFGSPGQTCNSCTCKGECANNDAAAKAVGDAVNVPNLTCFNGMHWGYCGNGEDNPSILVRKFHAACPISCNECHPEGCHQNDDVACDEGLKLRSSGIINVTILNCDDVALYNRTYDLCDYPMMRVACPQVCNWRGCYPTHAPTPAPTDKGRDAPSPNPDRPPDAPVVSTTGIFQDQPNPGPTPATASAQGDPHITNLLGKSFDLRQPGTYTLVQLPKEGPSLLKVEGLVQSIGNACTMFVTECNLTGLLFDGDSASVRASRENMYQTRHEQPTPFSLQIAPGEPWMALSSFPAGEEVLVKNYSSHGVVVEIKAKRDSVAAADGRGRSSSDAATQGFFLINIIAPRQPVHTQIKLSKRRAWFNVHVARLSNMGYAQVGGVLGITEPDEMWTEPTHACKRHMAGADAHPRMSLLRVEGDMRSDLSIADAGF